MVCTLTLVFITEQQKYFLTTRTKSTWLFHHVLFQFYIILDISSPKETPLSFFNSSHDQKEEEEILPENSHRNSICAIDSSLLIQRVLLVQT